MVKRKIRTREVSTDLDDQRRALSATLMANFSQFGSRVVISPFVLTIAITFDATRGQIGGVLTLLWATFALLQFPSGVLADRFGDRTVIVTALALTAAGSTLVALSPNLYAFSAAVLVLGVGTGLYFSVGTTLLSRLFDNNSRILGLHSAAGPFAGFIFPIVATTVAGRYGWRSGVALGAIVSLLSLVLVLQYVEPTSKTHSPGQPLRAHTVRDILTHPGTQFTLVLGTIGMYAFQSFVSFFPTFLIEYHGLSEQTTSTVFGATFVLVAILMPLTGKIADLIGTDTVVAGTMVISAGGFAGLLFGPSTVAQLVGAALVGTGLTWAGPLQTRFMQELPDGRQATGFGLCRTIFVFLGAAGNVITGTLAGAAGWPSAYGITGLLLVTRALLLALNRLFGAGY